MKREGQVWLVFFAALIGVPFAIATCSFLAGKIDEERTRIAGPESPGPERPVAGARA